MMVAPLLAGLTSGLLVSAQAMNTPVLDTEQLNEPAVPVDVEPVDVEPVEEETEEITEEEEATEDKIPEERSEEETTEEERRVVRPYDPLRSPTTCPTDIETLSALLIRDIPNYSNRVLQRAAASVPKDTQAPYRPAFVLVAGRPELEPLDLNNYAFTTDPTAGGPLTQLFFTTLSRQYSGNRYNDVQSYHWLFLAESTDGWWLAFMFSRIDDPETPRGPTAPRESSTGSVGQAVQLWLRDCRAGAIYPLE